jgi:pimeloyl-ACP methyl ester carboxylesterase
MFNSPRRRGFLIFGLLAIPAALYVGLMLVITSRQEALIFAGSTEQGSAATRIDAPPEWCELLELATPEGTRVAAVFAPAADASGKRLPDSAARPTVFYCYGSGHSLSRFLPSLDGLRRDGLNVLAPEYLGYGMSGGSPGEAGCLDAADAAYDHLLARKDIDPKKIIVEGGSLGAAVAVHLAERRDPAGLIMLSGFTSITDLSNLLYGFLPIDMLLRHPFDSVARIARVRCPILIAHGDRDEVVPFEMSERLLAAAPGARRLVIPGAGHSDTLYLCGPSGALLPTSMKGPHDKFTPEIHQTVRDFFIRCLGSNAERNAEVDLPTPSSSR